MPVFGSDAKKFNGKSTKTCNFLVRGCLIAADLFYIIKEQVKNGVNMSKKSNTLKENKEETEEIKEKETSSAPEESVSEKSEDLKKAEALAEDYKRKWYTVTAEYENFRKRNASAVSAAYRDGASDAVLKLLPVADNFGYAYDSASDEKTKAGIDKIVKSFATILQSLGIEEIKITPGDAFDESVAEAVMNVPCGEGEKPNTVKIVLKKGYRSGDKVIRYAQVSVTV